MQPTQTEKMPLWYRKLTRLERQLKLIQEEIPRNLNEKIGDFVDIESFTEYIYSMRLELINTMYEINCLTQSFKPTKNGNIKPS